METPREDNEREREKAHTRVCERERWGGKEREGERARSSSSSSSSRTLFLRGWAWVFWSLDFFFGIGEAVRRCGGLRVTRERAMEVEQCCVVSGCKIRWCLHRSGVRVQRRKTLAERHVLIGGCMARQGGVVADHIHVACAGAGHVDIHVTRASHSPLRLGDVGVSTATAIYLI